MSIEGASNELRMSSGRRDSSCSDEPGCITCGDVAVVLTVTVAYGADARCQDAWGQQEWVATELVGTVHPGDRLLVHAGVAIEMLSEG